MTIAPSLRRFVIALTALVATLSWPAGAVRAAGDSDIPGVPLPGPVVTGLLGGSIYDHVYAIDVPADRVVLLALSGDAGTDFDLYLYDGNATTIFGTTGLVASSTGPSSTESIVYPTQAGGRFYLDLNGASDLQGAFRLTVSVARDTNAPHADLRLDDGASATPDSTIRVGLVATDDLSGVADMQFSVDGTNWDDWRPYAPLTLWSFPQVDGPRTLWARVRDRAGNWSAPASATIVIDAVAPGVVSRSPGPPSGITTVRPTFRVAFSEPIVPETWMSLGLVLQDSAGDPVQGSYAYDTATRTGTFTPAADLVAGSVYVATLGNVTDFAGNPVVSVGSWIVRPLLSVVATLVVQPRTAVYGSVVSITGHVVLPISSRLTVERSVAGGPWKAFASVAPDASGNFALLTLANANSRYRVHASGSATEAEDVTAVQSLTVRQRVRLTPTPASGATIRLGTTQTLRVAVAPSSSGIAVTMTVRRLDASGRPGATVFTATRATVAGSAQFAWRPVSRGTYATFFTTPASRLLYGGVSPAYRWSVR